MQRNVKIYKINSVWPWISLVERCWHKSIEYNMVKSRHYHPIEILLENNIISVRWWSSDLRIPKIGWQTCPRTVILVWAFAVSGDREVNHLGNGYNRDTGVQNDAECTVKLRFYKTRLITDFRISSVVSGHFNPVSKLYLRYLLWGHIDFWCFEANFVGSWHFVFW